MIAKLKSAWEWIKLFCKCTFKSHVKPCSIVLYFGVPGAGKTTWAAYLTRQAMKKHKPVFSNVYIKGAYQYTRNDLGRYDIHDALMICDEAGLEFNNRRMNMTNDEMYFLKYHRHYQCDIVFLSQGLDCDITIRRLAQTYYLLQPSLIPGFIVRKKIVRKVGIDDNGQLIDKYAFQPLIFGGCKWIWGPAFRQYFDTLSRKNLPEKLWEKY